MSRQIKYLQLTKHELTYEVRIRAEEPKDRVEELRQQIAKLSLKFPAEDILDSCYDLPEDISGIKHTLTKTAINLASLKEDPQQKSLLERTCTYLNHVYHRLNRVVPAETADQVALVKETQEFYQEQWSKFQAILVVFRRTEQVPQVDAAVGTKDSAIAPCVDAQPSSCDLIHNIKVSCERGIASDISKYKYDGKSCVRSFIARIEEFRVAKDISEDKMLRLALEIFTGDALHWYRSVRDTIQSWTSLLALLRDDFDIANYDYRMKSEIRERSQGPSESITVYLGIMHGMFDRLNNKMSEEEKLEILFHNIRPCYSNFLATSPNITSIEHLRNLCKNYEKFKARSENFKEPPSLTSNTLAPEYAYQTKKDTVKNSFKTSHSPAGQNANNSTNYQRPPFYRANVSAIKEDNYCYRCRVNTHTMRECTADRVIKCFRCGLKDFRTPDCPKCNPKTNKSTSTPSQSKN